MADLSNKCAHLKSVVKEMREKYPIKDDADFRKYILKTLEIQKNLQDYISQKKNTLSLKLENFYHVDDDRCLKYENIDTWLTNQMIAIQDEIQELYEALGGSKYGSAAWKWWKTGHNEFLKSELKSILTEEDKEELKFEIIDIYHFIMNITLLGETLLGKDIADKIYKETIIDNDSYFYPAERNSKPELEFSIFGENALKYVKGFNVDFVKEMDSLFNSNFNNRYYAGITTLTTGLNLMDRILTLWEMFKLNSDDFIYYYLAKNKENIDRQDRGY